MTRPPLDDTPTFNIGRYRYAHRIAVGGMSEVYRALMPQQAGSDRAVVIKRLLPSLVEDPAQREMFEREVKLGLYIAHPNVVAALDHGEHEGAPYLVLEYVFGVDLFELGRWLLRRGRVLPVPTTIWLARELLAGLEAVHQTRDETGALLGVVHRDISQSNIFLSVHGDVKLGDLGIARVGEGSGPGALRRTKGKLGYLSPEQVMGRPVDRRGDVFSTAVVISELLLGRPLFSGATEIAVLLAIRDGDVSPIRDMRAELPEGLTEVLLSALQRKPEDRTASAAMLRMELALFAEGDPEEIRRELGAMVVQALDDGPDGPDADSLRATVETTVSSSRPPRMALPTPAEGIVDQGPKYRVTRRGHTLGVYTFSQVVRAVTMGEVRAVDQVQIGDGAPVLLAGAPELARHLPSSSRTPDARRRVEMASTSELYDLEKASMLSVLVEALVAEESGLLLCQRGHVRKEIYLDHGLPIFVTSNQPEELLGESLVRHGLISRPELEMALAIMPRFDGRLGESLLALGLVEAVPLFRHLGNQVRDRLLEAFSWPSGHAALYREVPPPERAFPLELDPFELLEEGALRRLDEGLDTSLDGRALHALVQTEFGLAPLLPSAQMAEIHMACEGPRALAELEGFAPSPEEARASVLVLLELGALQWLSGGSGR